MSKKTSRESPPRDYDDACERFDYRAVYGSDVTFLGVPRVAVGDQEAYREADVVIVGAPFDGGTSYRPGARFGPQAIRRADYLPMIPYRPHLDLGVDPFSVLDVVDAGDVAMVPGDIETALKRLEECIASIAASGAIPFVLGGDHSIALPNATGIARHLGQGAFAVIHFDAHADIGNLSDFGSRYGHGTPMRRILEKGTVRGDQFVQVGLRGYWPGPRTMQWAGDQGVRSYTMAEITRRGMGACLEEAFERVASSRGVYLSIDVDVVDPAMAPGTGTPEPGGLTARELLDAVRLCATRIPLVGLDVVEVAPPYDGPGNVTAFLANRIVLEALSGVAFRREKIVEETGR